MRILTLHVDWTPEQAILIAEFLENVTLEIWRRLDAQLDRGPPPPKTDIASDESHEDHDLGLF
jgi:hypothetical protein